MVAAGHQRHTLLTSTCQNQIHSSPRPQLHPSRRCSALTIRRDKLGDSKDRATQAPPGLKENPSFAFWPSDFDRRCPPHNRLTPRQAASALEGSKTFPPQARYRSRGKLSRSAIALQAPDAGLYLQCQKAKEMGVNAIRELGAQDRKESRHEHNHQQARKDSLRRD